MLKKLVKTKGLTRFQLCMTKIVEIKSQDTWNVILDPFILTAGKIINMRKRQDFSSVEITCFLKKMNLPQTFFLKLLTFLNYFSILFEEFGRVRLEKNI